jgi:hypothetical protein
MHDTPALFIQLSCRTQQSLCQTSALLSYKTPSSSGMFVHQLAKTTQQFRQQHETNISLTSVLLARTSGVIIGRLSGLCEIAWRKRHSLIPLLQILRSNQSYYFIAYSTLPGTKSSAQLTSHSMLKPML